MRNEREIYDKIKNISLNRMIIAFKITLILLGFDISVGYSIFIE